VTIERFWEDGRTPSRREVLHSRVRNGRRISINSWMRFGGRGSSSDDLGGEERIRRGRSRSLISERTVRRDVVDGKVGSCE